LHEVDKRAMTHIEATLERLALAFGARDIMIPAGRLTCAEDEVGAREELERNPDFNLIPLRNDEALHAYLRPYS
jgi:hypothetical protein